MYSVSMNDKQLEDELGKELVDLIKIDKTSTLNLLLCGLNVPDPNSTEQEWIKNSTLTSLDVLKLVQELVATLSKEARAVMHVTHPVNSLLTALGVIAVQSAQSGNIYLNQHNSKLPTLTELTRLNIRKILDLNLVSGETRDLLLTELGRLNDLSDDPQDDFYEVPISVPKGAPIH